jgi:hypothetical protein
VRLSDDNAPQDPPPPLRPAEQAIARYGSLEAAVENSDIPVRTLRRAWRRMAEAAAHTERASIAWSIKAHPFVPGMDGEYCVHCSLPAANQRHRPPEAA